MANDLESTTHKKGDRKRSLMLAAFDAIAERGYEGLRVRDVAFQVGINGATLHHYYPTKEVLIQEVLEYANNRLQTLLHDLIGTPMQQMDQYLHRLRLMMHTEPALFIVIAESNLRAQHGLALHYVMQQETFWQDSLATILRAGMLTGEWRAFEDADAIASTIVTLVEGAGMWIVAKPERADGAIKQIAAWLHLQQTES